MEGKGSRIIVRSSALYFGLGSPKHTRHALLQRTPVQIGSEKKSVRLV
jgi:hypothetical protein